MNLIKGKFCDWPYLVSLVLVRIRPPDVCDWALRVGHVGQVFLLQLQGQVQSRVYS